MQLALEQLITEGVEQRLDVWAGYSWGMPTGLLDEWITGIVVAPKWYKRAARELRVLEARADRYCGGRPLEAEEFDLEDLEEEDEPLEVMLDNGAFPAYRDGLELSLGEQLDDLHRGLELFPLASWIVAPDVVAQPGRSWARTVASLLELEEYGLQRVLVPFQNGMDVERVAGLAQELQSGVFVGGTVDWKLDAARELEDRGVYVHVGRVTTDLQLAECARLGVASIDSSSFLRKQWSNVARRGEFLQAFERYGRRRQGALDDQPNRHKWTAPAQSAALGYRS